MIICIVFGVDWPYAGHIDRDSSSTSENVAETGAVGGVVTEAELSSNQGHPKEAAKVGKNNGFGAWTKFFDENVPLKKRVYPNHLRSYNLMILLCANLVFSYISVCGGSKIYAIVIVNKKDLSISVFVFLLP